MFNINMFGEGSKRCQFLCAFLINVPCFGYGMAMSWISPMTLLLQSKDSPTGQPLTDEEVSWIAAIGFVACIPATFLIAFLGDTIGRKQSLLFGSCCGAATWICQLCSLKVWVFILARVLVGLAMANCYVTCTIYTKEISENSIRGALGCMVTLLVSSGNLSLYILGDVLAYNTILWICLSLPLFHLAVFTLMPDSPCYLIKQGKMKEAFKALSWLRCRTEDDALIKSEIDRIIKEQSDVKMKKKFLLKEILINGTLTKAFIISIVLIVARDVCGAITVLNLAGEIFTQASNGSQFFLTGNQQAMIMGVVQVAGALLASLIVERVGRKPLLIFTSILSGSSMCVLATWFLVLQYGVIGPSWIPVVSVCLTICSDSAGLKPMALVVATEIFSFEYRATVAAVTITIACITDFLQLLFFKSLGNHIGIYVSFYIFGAVCLSIAVYVFFAVPETKSRSLDEIYEELNSNRKKNVMYSITGP